MEPFLPPDVSPLDVARADGLRTLVRCDRPLWRRIPWLVALANGQPPWQEPPGYRVTFNTLDPTPIEKRIEGSDLFLAEQGIWHVATNCGVNCFSGELCEVTAGATARFCVQPASDSIVLQAYQALNLLDPRPLLAQEGGFLFAAYPDTIMDHLRVRHITPNFSPDGQPREALDEAILSLAGGWAGGPGELLEAASLLVASNV